MPPAKTSRDIILKDYFLQLIFVSHHGTAPKEALIFNCIKFLHEDRKSKFYPFYHPFLHSTIETDEI